MRKIKRNNTQKGFEIVKIQKIYNGTIFYENRTDLHKSDGFYDIIRPTLNENQKYGELTVECLNDETMEAVYPIVEITLEERQQSKKNEVDSNKQVKIQQLLEAKIIEEVQAETDVQTQLDNQDLYPFWEVGMSLKVDDKVQAFDNLEVKLYKTIQTHTTQSDWHPTQTPSLFVRVALEDEILDWVQPAGGHDAYNIGDKVKFNSKVYESIIDANVWSPTAYPQGWNEII